MPEVLNYRNYWDYRTGDATYRGSVLQVDSAASDTATVDAHAMYVPSFYVARTGSWFYAINWDGTTIYVNGAETVVGGEGDTGTISVTAGDVVTSSHPVALLVNDHRRAAPGDMHRGRKFGVHTSRYEPVEFHVYAIEDTTITYERSATTGVHRREDCAFVETAVLTAGQTHTFTSAVNGSHYFGGTGDFVMESNPDAGDGLTPYAATTEAMHWRSLNVELVFDGEGAPVREGSYLYHFHNGLFSGNGIADGAGGDTDPYVPVEWTAPLYVVTHELADFFLVSIEPCTVTAEYHDGTSWTTYGTYDLTAADRSAPATASVGAANGGDAPLVVGSNMWRFTSDGAWFYMRCNDPATDDEYAPNGMWPDGRGRIFASGTYAAESVEAQADEAFSFGTVAVSDDDVATTDAVTNYRSTVLADAPLMYASLDELSGPVQDHAGSNRHGEAVGPVVRGVDGRTGRGAYIDGADPAFPRLRWADATWMPSASFTVEALFRTTNTTNNMALFSYGGGNQLLVFYTNTFTYVYTGGAVVTLAHAAASDGAWHHMAITFDGTTTRLYLDGVLQSSGTGNTAISVAAGQFLVVGQEQDGDDGGYSTGQSWYGDVDEIAVYGTALTANQLGTHHTAAGGFFDVTSLLTDDDTAAGALTENRNFATVAVGDDDTAAVQLGGDDATFVYVTASDSAGAGVADTYALRASFATSETIQTQTDDSQVDLLVTFATKTDSADAALTEARDFATVAVSDDDTPTMSLTDVRAGTFASLSDDDTGAAAVSEARDFATVAVADTDTAATRAETGAHDYRSLVLSRSPVGYWPQGTTDYGGGGNGLTVVGGGGTTTVVDGVVSKSDYALHFAGGDVAYRATQSTLDYDMSGPFTIEAWHVLNAGYSGTRRGVFAIWGDNGTSRLILEAYTANEWVLTYRNEANTGWLRLFSLAGTAAPGETAHLAATWDGTTIRLYVNGEAVDESTNAPLLSNDSKLAIVGGYNGNIPPNGTTDEPAFYTTALSAAQVEEHYLAGASSTEVDAFLTFTDAAEVELTENGVNDVYISVNDTAGVAETEAVAQTVYTGAFDNNLGVVVNEATGDEFVTFSVSDGATLGLTEERDFATVAVSDDDVPAAGTTDEVVDEYVYLSDTDAPSVNAVDVHITPVPVFLSTGDDAGVGTDDTYDLLAYLTLATDTPSLSVVDVIEDFGVLQYMWGTDATDVTAEDFSATMNLPYATDSADAGVAEARDFAPVDVGDSDTAAAEVAGVSDNSQVFLSFSDTAEADTTEARSFAVTQFNYADDTAGVFVGYESATFVPRYATDNAGTAVEEVRDFATVEVTDSDTAPVAMTEAFEFSTVIVTDDDDATLTADDAALLVASFAAQDEHPLTLTESFLFSTVIVADSDLIMPQFGAEQTATTVLQYDSDVIIVEVTGASNLIAMFTRYDDPTVDAEEQPYELTAYVTDNDDAAVAMFDIAREVFFRTYGLVTAPTLTLDGEGRTPKGGRAATQFFRQPVSTRARATTAFGLKQTNRGVPRGDGPRDG